MHVHIQHKEDKNSIYTATDHGMMVSFISYFLISIVESHYKALLLKFFKELTLIQVV